MRQKEIRQFNIMYGYGASKRQCHEFIFKNRRQILSRKKEISQ